MTPKMKMLIAIVVATALGLGVGYIAGAQGRSYWGIPVFFLCALWAYALNWLAYIPAMVYKTEKYYDLIGGLTYITTILMAFWISANNSSRAMIVTLLVTVWSARLGFFLFARISRDGHDKRFDQIKTNPVRFFLTWTLQATWVVLTSACAWVIITAHNDYSRSGSTLSETTLSQPTWDTFATIGLSLWILGFLIEVVADAQKFSFRSLPANADKFITTGLWARAQHPNYFGEIVLWIGIAIMALPVLSGGAWLALISPLFVMFLLLRISGVPLLQKAGMEKWGNDPDYIVYRSDTPKLIPKLFL